MYERRRREKKLFLEDTCIFLYFFLGEMERVCVREKRINYKLRSRATYLARECICEEEVCLMMMVMGRRWRRERRRGITSSSSSGGTFECVRDERVNEIAE
jgi:hypothetical protein